METWQIITAIIIVGLSIIMPIYYSSEKKKKAQQEELEKIKDQFSFSQISNEGMPITRFQQRAIKEGRSIYTFLLKALDK